MCLRIKFCNHHRPRRTKLFKSLYPNVQYMNLLSNVIVHVHIWTNYGHNVLKWIKFSWKGYPQCSSLLWLWHLSSSKEIPNLYQIIYWKAANHCVHIRGTATIHTTQELMPFFNPFMPIDLEHLSAMPWICHPWKVNFDLRCGEGGGWRMNWGLQDGLGKKSRQIVSILLQCEPL